MTAKKIYQSRADLEQPKSIKKKKRPPNKAKRNILIGMALTTVSLMSAVTGALLAVSFSGKFLQQVPLSPEQAEVFNTEEPIVNNNISIPELPRPVNILILGVKVLTSDLERKGEEIPEDLGYHATVNSFEGLSDTMLLLRLDPQKEKLSVLSIPRDTKVNIPGYGNRKINHANDYGGAALTASAVEELLGGVEIDRYVRVNVLGVEKLIDALGGVDVYVPKDMKYNDFSQHLYINLKKGEQKLDGEKVIQFLRFRHDGLGDIGRVQRQQMVMRAIVEQALKPSTVIKIPEILSVIKSHLDTNLDIQELRAIANFASKTERSDVQMLMIPGDFNDATDKVSYWIPNYYKIRKLTEQHFDVAENNKSNNKKRNFKGTRIAIQNSLEEREPARKLLTTLRKAGYYNAYISDKNWSEPLKMTKIVAQTGDTEAAKDLQSTLGIGEVLVESTGVIRSDVSIQVGEDWQMYLDADR